MMRLDEPEKMLEPVHPISVDDNRKARRAREAELRKHNEDLLKENARLRMALEAKEGRGLLRRMVTRKGESR